MLQQRAEIFLNDRAIDTDIALQPTGIFVGHQSLKLRDVIRQFGDEIRELCCQNRDDNHQPYDQDHQKDEQNDNCCGQSR